MTTEKKDRGRKREKIRGRLREQIQRDAERATIQRETG